MKVFAVLALSLFIQQANATTTTFVGNIPKPGTWNQSSLGTCTLVVYYERGVISAATLKRNGWTSPTREFGRLTQSRAAAFNPTLGGCNEENFCITIRLADPGVAPAQVPEAVEIYTVDSREDSRRWPGGGAGGSAQPIWTCDHLSAL